MGIIFVIIGNGMIKRFLFKGPPILILSDPPFKKGHFQITMVPFKALMRSRRYPPSFFNLNHFSHCIFDEIKG